MPQSNFIPTKVKYRGYFAESRPDGRWNLRGRGERRTISHEELYVILNGRPKAKAQ